MTRKDYILIAAAINASFAATLGHSTDNNENRSLFNSGINTVTENIADAIAKDNPNFDKTRFLAACNTNKERIMARELMLNTLLTDTFGGQANYSWTRKTTGVIKKDASRRSIIMRAKRDHGLTGMRGNTEWSGDYATWKPSNGACIELQIEVLSVE